MPKIFKENRIAATIGLSGNNFNANKNLIFPDGKTMAVKDGQLACGMCIRAYYEEGTDGGFNEIDCQLQTVTEQGDGTARELIFMVADQCNDPKCVNNGSWIDIDDMSDASKASTLPYKWEPVDCPVGTGDDELKIELALNQIGSKEKYCVWPMNARYPTREAHTRCKGDSEWKSMDYNINEGYCMYYILCDGRDREIKFTSFHADEIIVPLADSELIDDPNCSMETVWNNYGKGCQGGTLGFNSQQGGHESWQKYVDTDVQVYFFNNSF